MGVIVVGYDDSDGANAALDQAIELCRAFGDRLVIVFGAAPPGRSVGDEWRAHAAAIRELAVEASRHAVARAEAAGIETAVAIAEERPAEALADTAVREDARMIVVGTYGERPLRAALVGSTPNRLLYLADRPVVVVPVGGG